MAIPTFDPPVGPSFGRVRDHVFRSDTQKSHKGYEISRPLGLRPSPPYQMQWKRLSGTNLDEIERRSNPGKLIFNLEQEKDRLEAMLRELETRFGDTEERIADLQEAVRALRAQIAIVNRVREQQHHEAARRAKRLKSWLFKWWRIPLDQRATLPMLDMRTFSGETVAPYVEAETFAEIWDPQSRTGKSYRNNPMGRVEAQIDRRDGTIRTAEPFGHLQREGALPRRGCGVVDAPRPAVHARGERVRAQQGHDRVLPR